MYLFKSIIEKAFNVLRQVRRNSDFYSSKLQNPSSPITQIATPSFKLFNPIKAKTSE